MSTRIDDSGSICKNVHVERTLKIYRGVNPNMLVLSVHGKGRTTSI